MGRIRNKKVRHLAKIFLEKFPNLLTTDFEENKRILDRIAKFRSKKLRNQVAGLIVHILKQRQKLMGETTKWSSGTK